MNKHAASTLMIIFEVLVVVLIVSLTVNIASKYANSKAITSSILAEDLALMVETLLAVPGDSIIEYPYNTPFPYTIILNNQQVILFDSAVPDSRVEKKFHLPLGYSAEGSVEEKIRVCLEKKSKSIRLRECP